MSWSTFTSLYIYRFSFETFTLKIVGAAEVEAHTDERRRAVGGARMPTSSTFGMSSDGLKTRSARAKAKPPPGSAPRHSAPARGTVGTGASRFHGAPASPARRSAELNTTPAAALVLGCALARTIPRPRPSRGRPPSPRGAPTPPRKRRVSLVERQTQYAKGRASSIIGGLGRRRPPSLNPRSPNHPRDRVPRRLPRRGRPAEVPPRRHPPRSPRSPSSSVTPIGPLHVITRRLRPAGHPEPRPRTSMNPTTHTASGGAVRVQAGRGCDPHRYTPRRCPRGHRLDPRACQSRTNKPRRRRPSLFDTPSAAVAASPGKLGALSPVTSPSHSPTRERPDTERARAAKAVQERMFAEFDAERRGAGGVEDPIAEFNENRLPTRR